MMLITPMPISKREKEVLQLVALGETSIRIAKQLGISKYTVDNHRKNMLRKTGTNSSLELVMWATKEGFLG